MKIPEEKKVAVLKALYARAFRAPISHFVGSTLLTDGRAKEALSLGYIDYLDGHLIKMDLHAPNVDTRLYDRDTRRGLGEEIIMDVLTDPSLD